MKVVLYRGDTGGCGHYRVSQPAAHAGVECAITDQVPVDWRNYTDGSWRVVGVRPPDADVAVFQRPLLGILADAIPFFQRAGVACVVEIDDDFRSLHPDNAAFVQAHPRHDPRSNWNHLGRACGHADLVTVTTPALADRYGAHGRVAVLPNYVDAALLDAPPAGDGRTAGWTGTVATHRGDLEVTRGGVAQAVVDADARFKVVGRHELVAENLALPAERLDATGWLALDDYYRQLATIDVGIVPLTDSKFNRAKSWLKGLEMAACGVPFVASPLPEYQRLAGLGAGVLARARARDWRREVRALLGDPVYRDERRDRGRRAARGLTIQGNGWRWAEAWQQAIDNHRAGRRAA